MLKTSVMMIGEMEYTAIFLGLEGIADPNSSEAHSLKTYYSGITYALFVTFLIILSIIIMNLLVGLAVDDIKAVQEKAALTRLAMQVGSNYIFRNSVFVLWLHSVVDLNRFISDIAF
jgi:transient receptor potential cation channel subfamily A protein 1